MPDSAESGGGDRRYLFLLGEQNAWAGFKELDTCVERMEDRGDLNTGVTGADNKHRRRDGGKAPGVAVSARQLESGNWQPPAHSPGANDDLICLKPEAALGLNGVWVHEARGPGLLMNGHA